jgi:endonuclease/exonuclease/phosphatase family metal-dependent hydrolase
VPPPTSSQLKVLSWNGSFGKGTDNIFNLDRTATHIANLNVDVAALCEIPSTIAVNLRDLVAQKTGQTWYYYHVAKYSGTTEGNLILSRYPILSSDYRYLSYQRSVAQARISIGGRNINIFATHLDPDSSGARATEVGELKSFASGFAEPRIICGDFNAGPDTSEVSDMTSGYYDSWMQALNSSSATAYPDNPLGAQTRTRRGRIDYIWYSNGTNYLALRNAQIPDSRNLNDRNVVVYLGTLDDLGVRPSDHNQVVATFDIR